MRQKRVAGRAPQVQEEGPVRPKYSQDFAGPFCAPEEEGLARRGIVVAAIVDSQVVRRGSDDQVHAFIFEFGHAAKAIAKVELE